MHNMVSGDHDVCSNNNNILYYIPLACIIKEIIYRLDPGGHLHTQGPGHTLSLTHTHIHSQTLRYYMYIKVSMPRCPEQGRERARIL